MEMMMELRRRGYLRAAATGGCGRAAGQYDVALVDWRRRPLRTLETALDWLVNFLSPSGVLVVWVDAQKPTANQSLRALLETRGFIVMQGTVHESVPPFRRGDSRAIRSKRRLSVYQRLNSDGESAKPPAVGPSKRRFAWSRQMCGAVIREWMSLAREKRKSGEQAFAFAKVAIQRHKLPRSRRSAQDIVMGWPRPSTGRP
jgi:hypothetical protein